MKPSILRPIRIAISAFLGFLVLALVAAAWLTILESRQLAKAHEAFAKIREFHRVHLMVERRMIHLGEGEKPGERREVTQTLDQLKSLSDHPDTPIKLGEVGKDVDAAPARRVAVETIVKFEEIAITERDGQAELLAQLQRDTLAELQIDIAIPLAIVVGSLILFPLARRRILQPLEAFGRQLARVGEGDFSPAPEDETNPLLLPLHRSFNDLMERLRTLEAQHEARTSTLQKEVRDATRALLEQQRSLARAERLAATGELAATVAHELRNPLAGIEMTLHNLRAEIPDPELARRIDRVVEEVDRLSRLLNQLLDAARHKPEKARPVDVGAVARDLLELTRHQIPAGITLEDRVPAGLASHLPQDQLRQALLNLVLNAAAALGEKGTITVSAAREAEAIRIDVCDDGAGFPPEILEGGVRPFLSTREQGTGLGLAVARRFARDVGGELRLANRAPHGACATLLLPSMTENG